jgi:hypothetical protein
MKHITAILLLSGFGFCTKAQESNDRVISISATGINGYYTRSFEQSSGDLLGRSTSFGLRSELTYGKWNRNHLWFFGVNAEYFIVNSSSSGSNTNKRFAILPTIGYQFRTSVTNKLYFSQIVKLNVGYSNYRLGIDSDPSQDQKLKGIAGGITYSPLCLLFDANHTLNILFQLGEVSLDFERVKYDGGQNNGVITKAFNLTGQLNSITIGVQFKLH